MKASLRNLIYASACLLAAGCASFGGRECGADAYSLGQRDGRLGASHQAPLYEQRCGVPVDRHRYEEGWRAGFGQRPTPLW